MNALYELIDSTDSLDPFSLNALATKITMKSVVRALASENTPIGASEIMRIIRSNRDEYSSVDFELALHKLRNMGMILEIEKRDAYPDIYNGKDRIVISRVYILEPFAALRAHCV